MSEAKFTKGEWAVDCDNCDYGGGEWYVIGNAKVEFSYRATTEEREEAKANAHLISAAPDMYEILESLAKMSSEDAKLYLENSSDLIDLLAKARGE